MVNIAILSAKGGTGKTTLAVALAHQYALANPDREVVLIDADNQGNVAISLELGGENSLGAYLYRATDTLDLIRYKAEIPFLVVESGRMHLYEAEKRMHRCSNPEGYMKDRLMGDGQKKLMKRIGKDDRADIPSFKNHTSVTAGLGDVRHDLTLNSIGTLPNFRIGGYSRSQRRYALRPQVRGYGLPVHNGLSLRSDAQAHPREQGCAGRFPIAPAILAQVPGHATVYQPGRKKVIPQPFGEDACHGAFSDSRGSVDRDQFHRIHNRCFT